MPLGSNPAFSAVRSFFNGPANFSAYTRGGGVVPNIPANANISTTAAGLRLTQFSGADKTTGATLTAESGSVSASGGGNSIGGTVTGSVGLTPGGGNGSFAMSAAVIGSFNVTSPSASATTTRGYASGGLSGAPPQQKTGGTVTDRKSVV